MQVLTKVLARRVSLAQHSGTIVTSVASSKSTASRIRRSKALLWTYMRTASSTSRDSAVAIQSPRSTALPCSSPPTSWPRSSQSTCSATTAPRVLAARPSTSCVCDEGLAISDTQSVPAFSDEKAYHVILGAPLLWMGNTVGMLKVKSQASWVYYKEKSGGSKPPSQCSQR